MNVSEWRAFEVLKTFDLRVLPQVPLGGYTVDFLLPEVGAIVEVDGRPYHERADDARRDRRRDADLQALGYLTIHVWTDDLRSSQGRAKVRRHVLVRLFRSRGIRLAVRGADRLYSACSRRRP